MLIKNKTVSKVDDEEKTVQLFHIALYIIKGIGVFQFIDPIRYYNNSKSIRGIM
jgi:hypothetical protein